MLEAVNREQYRIGNDLHDGLGQELTGIALMLRGVAGRLAAEYPPILPGDRGHHAAREQRDREHTRSGARSVAGQSGARRTARTLWKDSRCTPRRLYGVHVVCTYRGVSADPLNPELANHLYRIAQEAVRNAVRHGQRAIYTTALAGSAR